jgi:hypothetical protein
MMKVQYARSMQYLCRITVSLLGFLLILLAIADGAISCGDPGAITGGDPGPLNCFASPSSNVLCDASDGSSCAGTACVRSIINFYCPSTAYDSVQSTPVNPGRPVCTPASTGFSNCDSSGPPGSTQTTCVTNTFCDTSACSFDPVLGGRFCTSGTTLKNAITYNNPVLTVPGCK